MAFSGPAAEQQSSRAAEPPFSFAQHAALFGIALFFALGTSVLSWSNLRAADLTPRFHWPDETTNYFFASRVAHGESLAVPEPRNIDAGNLIHPRTANVRADGTIVPGAYLGLPLWYGMIGRIFSVVGGSVGGERAMLFVTPILAAFGLLAFASIVRRLVNPTVAVIATVLLVLHPSVWLFIATAMLSNVPFVALLLMGFAVVLRKEHSNDPNADSHVPNRTRGIRSIWMRFEAFGCTLRWFLGGLLIGLALTIRTHELLWVGAMLAVLAWRSYKRQASSDKQSFRSACGLLAPRSLGEVGRLVACGFGIILPFIPILLLNSQLYDSPFTTGYALLQENGAAPTEFAPSLLPGWLTALVAPFGWHPIEAFTRFWKYMVVPYPWFVGLVALWLLVGIAGYIRRKLEIRSSNIETNSKSEVPKFGHSKLFRISDFGFRISTSAIIGSIALVVWLILYYGSWELSDPLVRETNVLTISYVRYWLPIVVVLAPWVAVGLLTIIQRVPTRWRMHTVALVFLGIILTSFSQVVTDPTEGLLRQRQAIDEHRTRARAVIAATESDAVIVSHRMDKVFFPERAVVHASGDPTTDAHFLQNLRTLVDRTPVYRYTGGPIAMPGFTLEPTGAMPFGEQLARISMTQ